MTSEGAHALAPGWYARLSGEEQDLDDWVEGLKAPFDPFAFRDPDAGVLLSSTEFAVASTPEEARERALSLIDRLNGALAIVHWADPVRFNGLLSVNEDGQRRQHIFATAIAATIRVKGHAVATVLDANGNPRPSPPPQPSAAQAWNALAADDHEVSDLLEQIGKAEGWYEIYKAIEIAEGIVGGKHKLADLMGASKSNHLAMRETANFYRHARAKRPKKPIELNTAKSMLHSMARIVLGVSEARLRKS